MKRNSHAPNEKTRLVLETMKGAHTLSEMASENNIHPNMLSKWKKEAIAELASISKNNSIKNITLKKSMNLKSISFMHR